MVGHLGDELKDRPARHASGGQFDGEREAVHAAAQLADRSQVPRTERRTAGGGRPFQEQRDRRPVGGGVQRLESDALLAGHFERLAARGEDVHPRRPGQHGRREPGGAVDDLLAVVEDEQDPLRGEELHEAVGDVDVGAPFDPQRGRHGVWHLLVVQDRGQRAAPDAVRVVAGDGVDEVPAQPGLADPARPDDGDQAGAPEQARKVGQLGVPAEEGIWRRCERRGSYDVNGRLRRGFGRAGHPVPHDLDRGDRVGQALQIERPDRAQRGALARWEQPRDLTGREDLTRGRPVAQPLGDDDWRAKVVLAVTCGFARLHADADGERRPVPGTVVSPYRALHRHRGGERGRRATEGHHEPVPEVLHLAAAVGDDGPPQKAEVDPAERLRTVLAQPLRELRRPDQVGEQQRDGPGV